MPNAPAQVSLGATASDPDGSIKKVSFYRDGQLLGSSTTAPYSFTWTDPPAGDHRLTARATDDLGAVSESAPLGIHVNVPPSVSIAPPASAPTAGSDLSLTLDAQDSDGQVMRIDVSRDGQPLASLSAPPWQMTWPQVPAGEHRLIARATDEQGGWSDSEAVVVRVAGGEAEAGGLYYLEPDHLGTPRAVSDEAGRTVWRWANREAYGDDPPEEDPDGNGQRFSLNLRLPGQYFDAETGLHYNYFRDYDPSSGRYVESDPIGLAGGINPYAYADNAPTMLTDPLGLMAIPVPPVIIPPGGGGAGNGGGKGGGGEIVWPPGYDPNLNPPTQCQINVPPPQIPPPPKPNCESMYDICMKTCRAVKPGKLGGVYCWSVCSVQYAICKKTFGGH